MGANFDSRRMLRRGIEGGRVTGNEMLSRRAHRRMYMLASKVCGLASLGATGFCEYELFLLLCLFSPVSLHVHTRSREWTPNATAKMAISSVDYTDINLHWGLGVVRHWREAHKRPRTIQSPVFPRCFGMNHAALYIFYILLYPIFYSYIPKAFIPSSQGSSIVLPSFELLCANSITSMTPADCSHFTSCSALPRIVAARFLNRFTYAPGSFDGHLLQQKAKSSQH